MGNKGPGINEGKLPSDQTITQDSLDLSKSGVEEKTLNAGEKLKHYTIEKLLGRGAMGEVYQAHDSVLDRKVAVKVISKRIEEDPQSKARFIREAKSAASLDHAFICKIYEIGEENGQPFIVMEYVEGYTLKDAMLEGKIPLKDSLKIANEVADALEKAHNKKIIHRDLKPANIMLTPQGHIKVMDFGLAKKITDIEDSEAGTITQEFLSAAGSVAGTPAYMSPEQSRGEFLDGRSDLFALGIILYEMVSGNHPFARGSVVDTLAAIQKEPPAALTLKTKSILPKINRIIRKSMAKDLENRYAGAAEMAEDLQKAQRDLSISLFGRLPVWIPAAAFVVIFGLVSLITWQLGLFTRVKEAPPPPEPISLVVADFQNLTGETAFDGGAMEQTLLLGLEEGSFIKALDRADAAGLAAELAPKSGGKLDFGTAQLISRSRGINVIVEGIVEKKGRGYEVRVLARDSTTSEVVVDVSRSVSSRVGVMSAAAGLAARLVAKLGDVPLDSVKTLSEETFTTSSLEAMNAYAQAQEMAEIGKNEEAIQLYEQAIREDPEMGRAYGGLAALYFNMGDKEKANDIYQEAMANIDRMTDREKYRTRGLWYVFQRNYLKAIEEYSALVEQFPAEEVGTSNLALAYFYARDMKRALEVGLKSVELSPTSIDSRYNVAWYAIGAGDFVKAEEYATAVVAEWPDYEETYICLALACIDQGRITEATAHYEKLATLSDWGFSLSTVGQADLALYEGRYKEGISLLRSGIQFDEEKEKPGRAATKWAMLADAYLMQGKKTEALEAAERAASLSKDLSILHRVGKIYAATEKWDRAAAITADIARGVNPEPQSCAKVLRGESLLQQDNPGEAATTIQEALGILDSWIGHFTLGEAYLRAEDYPSAHSEFEACIQRRGEAASVYMNDIPSMYVFPPVYYYLALTQEAMRSGAARESFEKFLAIKEKADGDWMVEDARRRLAGLNE